MGAEGFHGRVRDGIGWVTPRYGHQVVQRQRTEIRGQRSEDRTGVLLSSVLCPLSGREGLGSRGAFAPARDGIQRTEIGERRTEARPW
jgi:hypothetical protein